MKKLCTLIVMMTFIVITAMGQGFNPQAKLESDKEVRTGKLENGLTYYIRHNAKPAQRAEFYILS
jgi:zinc protease